MKKWKKDKKLQEKVLKQRLEYFLIRSGGGTYDFWRRLKKRK